MVAGLGTQVLLAADPQKVFCEYKPERNARQER